MLRVWWGRPQLRVAPPDTRVTATLAAAPVASASVAATALALAALASAVVSIARPRRCVHVDRA